MAIWDDFLTERDRAHLERSGLGARPHKPLGSRPALLIVDAYVGAMGPRGSDILDAVVSAPLSCGTDAWSAVDRMQELLATAREHETLTVFTTNSYNPLDHWNSREPHIVGRDPQTDAEFHRIVDELKPLEDELVIEKSAASAFWGTPLVAHLIASRIDTVIVCGESTSGCVRASVVDGAMYRFRMGVVEDCTFDRTEASHALSLFDMDQKYGRVMSSQDAMEYFRSCSDGGPNDPSGRKGARP